MAHEKKSFFVDRLCLLRDVCDGSLLASFDGGAVGFVRALLGTDGSPEQQHVWLCCGLVRAQREEEKVRQRKCVEANHLTLGGGD